MPHQRNRILHRQFRARADREMRGVRGIADEHAVAVMPMPAFDPIEIEPRRTAQMPRVRQQRRIAQVGGKQFFAKCNRLVGIGLVQAVRLPGLLAGFHNDGRKVLAELVGVNLKPSELGFLERKGERGELLGRAEPNVAAFAHFDVRAEFLGLPRPGLAVGALCDDDEIGAVEFVGVVELVLKSLLHAERGGALLQNAEKHAARNAGEAVSAGSGRSAP